MRYDYKFTSSTKHRNHFTEAVEFFDLKNNETQTVDVYSPYEELKTNGLKFESTNFGEYTLTLSI